MKKTIFGLILLLLAGVVGVGFAAFFLKIRPEKQESRATELLPAETLLLVHLPDCQRTVRRWDLTALSQILREPEMVSFMEKPRAKLAANLQWLGQVEKYQQIQPREAFVAVTSVDGPAPKIVAGMSFSGPRARFDALLKESLGALKSAHPAGKSDLITYDGAEIESFTDKETTVAGVFRGDWYFVSNNLELLERTLDRYDRKPELATGSLADAAFFTKATAPLPVDRDLFLFAQPGTLVERAGALMAARGIKSDEQPLAGLKSTQAIAVSTKLDGTQFRDTIFVLSSAHDQGATLARHSLACTSPAALMYFATSLPATLKLPGASVAMASQWLPALDPMEKALAAKGLKFEDLGKAFGPELGALVDWPQAALQPTVLLALDVRDPVNAQAFTEVLASMKLAGADWTKTSREGASIYSAATVGGMSPVLGLSEKFLIVGLSEASVVTALDRAKAGGANLGSKPEFEVSARGLPTGTKTYAYVDLRGTFERAYGTFRPFIGMAVAFSPEAGHYIDAGKLPTTDAIARHLGPMIFSQSTTADGMLMESTGPLTLNQAVLGMAAGSLASALPNLKNRSLKDLDPAKTLPKKDAQAPTPAPESAPAPGDKLPRVSAEAVLCDPVRSYER